MRVQRLNGSLRLIGLLLLPTRRAPDVAGQIGAWAAQGVGMAEISRRSGLARDTVEMLLRIRRSQVPR